MSSRFSITRPPYLPPAICHKSAPKPPTVLPPFQSQNLQAYVYWEDPYGSLAWNLSGYMTLQANPPFFTWSGILEGKTDDLGLQMLWNYPSPSADFIIARLSGGAPIQSAQLNNVLINPTIPFQSPLLIFPNGAPPKRRRAQLYA